MKWLLSLLTILVLVQPVYGQRAKYQAWCEQGGFQVQTQGQNSTTRVQRSFPVCTITVFNHGTTTRATIFSSEQGAMLANPFENQDRNTGQYFFYAAIGRYDIQIAAAGLMTFTLRDVIVGNGATGPAGPPGPPGPQGPPGSGGGGGGGDGKNCGLTAIAMTDIAECAARNGGVGYPQWWGAKADGKVLGGAGGGNGCYGNAGTPVVSCSNTNYTFTASDVGKHFDFAHAGVHDCGPSTYGRSDLLMNCNLVGTILSVDGPAQITLSTPVISSVGNEQFAFASSDDQAVQAAFDSGIPTIALVGVYGITGSLAGTTLGDGVVGGVFVNRAVTAPGPGVGRLLRIGPVAWDGLVGAVFVVENGSRNFTMTGVSIWGTNALGELTTFGPTHDGLIVCSGIPNSAICNGFPGNTNGSINDIRILNCDFSHSWGIGFHAPGSGPPGSPGIYDVRIAHSTANYNSYDGFNPNFTDGTILDGVTATHNGTGGIEIGTYGSVSITGSILNSNKEVGLSFGGFQGSGINRTCRITGNDMSENGNGSVTLGEVMGMGMIIGDGAQNCAITGNTFRHNHYLGLETNLTTEDSHLLIANNIISTNGASNLPLLSLGSYGSMLGATYTGNQIINEAYGTIKSIGRTNNLVTVVTATAVNYRVGYTLYIHGTPNQIFDITAGTVASVINGSTFTFAQTGPDVPVELYEAGLEALGVVYSPTGGFNQNQGLVVTYCNESDITDNTVRGHDFSNVTFLQYLPGNPYIHCHFRSDTNTIGYSMPSSTGLRDFYLIADRSGVPGPFVPKAGGLVADIPSIQVIVPACTTAASAGATCTVMFGHGFNDDLGYSLSSADVTARTRTTCSFDNTTMPPIGHPVVLSVVQTNWYSATATIGTFDGQAAGGGTMKCVSNYNY